VFPEKKEKKKAESQENILILRADVYGSSCSVEKKNKIKFLNLMSYTLDPKWEF